MKTVLYGLLGLAMLCYPFVIFFGLSHFDPRLIAYVLFSVILLRFLFQPSKARADMQWPARITLLAGIVIVGAVQFLHQDYFIKLYPVFMSMIMLGAFSYTLRFPPSMLERVARLHTKKLPPEAVPYLAKVTMVWCGFFFINGCIALYTVFWAPLAIWTLYNGLLSYLIMGTLFVGELVVRQKLLRYKKAKSNHKGTKTRRFTKEK